MSCVPRTNLVDVVTEHVLKSSFHAVDILRCRLEATKVELFEMDPPCVHFFASPCRGSSRVFEQVLCPPAVDLFLHP